jgi:hypothetical protein
MHTYFNENLFIKKIEKEAKTIPDQYPLLQKEFDIIMHGEEFSPTTNAINIERHFNTFK